MFEKNSAVLFWSAYYLPLLHVFLFAIVDGFGPWFLICFGVFLVAGKLFGTFTLVRHLPRGSKWTAMLLFPGAICGALIARSLGRVDLLLSFTLFAILVVAAVMSCMQMYYSAKS